MAAFHSAITMTGSAIRLSSVLPEGWAPQVHFLSLQASAANAAVMYVGAYGQTLSSSNYGQRIEIPVTSIPAAPAIFEFGGGASVDLSQMAIVGTASDVVRIFVST